MLDQARARARASAEATAEVREQGEMRETRKLERLPNVVMSKGGYAIQAPNGGGFWGRLTQGIAGAVVLSSFTFAGGLWLLPSTVEGAGIDVFRMSATFILMLIGTLGVYFLSQRRTYQVQIDQNLREVREVLKSPSGKELIVRRCPFEEVESIFLARSKENENLATLKMRHETYQIDVLTADATYLELLRDLLARDILGANVAASVSAVPEKTTKRSKKAAAADAA